MDRAEDLPTRRNVNHTHLRFAMLQEGNADGEIRQAMGKIRRAIDRIDQPIIISFRVMVCFLGHDRVVRECLPQAFNNDLFEQQIISRQWIIPGLVRYGLRQRIDGLQHGPRLMGERFRDVQAPFEHAHAPSG